MPRKRHFAPLGEGFRNALAQLSYLLAVANENISVVFGQVVAGFGKGEVDEPIIVFDTILVVDNEPAPDSSSGSFPDEAMFKFPVLLVGSISNLHADIPRVIHGPCSYDVGALPLLHWATITE